MIQGNSATRGCQPVRKVGKKSANPTSPSTPDPSGTGFTLVELLVAVAIIVILIALLFPALRSVGDKSASAKCAGNLKGLGAAVGVNAAENNGKWLIMDQMYGSWDKTMRDRGIMDSDKASFCPSAEPKSYGLYQTYGVTWMGVTAVPEDQNVLLYSTNTTGTRTYYEINMLAISQPAKYLIMADSFTTRFRSQYHIVQGNTGMDEIQLRHNGRANVLFADGHVDALDTKGLKQIGWRMAFDKKGVLTNF